MIDFAFYMRSTYRPRGRLCLRPLGSHRKIEPEETCKRVIMELIGGVLFHD